MIDYTDTARDIAVNLYTNGTITDCTMTGDGNGNDVIARLATRSGHVIVLSTEIHEGDEAVTYSVYAPEDTDLEAEITTDGFEVDTEDQATADMAEIITRLS